MVRGWPEDGQRMAGGSEPHLNKDAMNAVRKFRRFGAALKNPEGGSRNPERILKESCENPGWMWRHGVG